MNLSMNSCTKNNNNNYLHSNFQHLYESIKEFVKKTLIHINCHFVHFFIIEKPKYK